MRRVCTGILPWNILVEVLELIVKRCIIPLPLVPGGFFVCHGVPLMERLPVRALREFFKCQKVSLGFNIGKITVRFPVLFSTQKNHLRGNTGAERFCLMPSLPRNRDYMILCKKHFRFTFAVSFVSWMFGGYESLF